MNKCITRSLNVDFNVLSAASAPVFCWNLTKTRLRPSTVKVWYNRGTLLDQRLVERNKPKGLN